LRSVVAIVSALAVAGCSLHGSAASRLSDGSGGAGSAVRPASNALIQTVEAANPQLTAALLEAAAVPGPAAYRRVAREYRRAGILDQAHEYFTRAVKLDPADADSHEGLARIWRDWGTPHLGLADAYRAVHYAPDSPSAANTLGTLLQALGYTGEAKEWYGRALSLDPNAWYALNNLCYAAIMTRELAIDMCRAAVTAAPDAKAPRNNLALAHAAAGDLDGAQRWFRRAGDTAESHYNYGVVLMGRREYAQAADAFRKALELDPLHGPALVRVRQADRAVAQEERR
jgi:tetratricopeptide (TPR) repeat protein